MRESARKRIESAADDTIAQMLKARWATNDAKNGILTRPTPANLQALVDSVAPAHQNATKSAQELVEAVARDGVEWLTQSAQAVVGKVANAASVADQLKSTQTEAQANMVADADNEATEQLTRFKDTFYGATESERNPFPVFTSFTATQALGLAAGAAVFVLAVVGLVLLGGGILKEKHIVSNLSKVEYARGLITYIFAIGTIAIALVLVVAALFGSEETKDNFGRGKEILTVLIGVFGTILGFYFGLSTREGREIVGTAPSGAVTPSGTVVPSGTVAPSGTVTPSGAVVPSGTVTPSGRESPS